MRWLLTWSRGAVTAAFLALPTLLLPVSVLAQELSLETLASGLDSPVAVTHAGDERVFITLQDGRIVIHDGSGILPQPFLDIESLVLSGGERGLLSAAFHPDYSQNGYFFVDYTDQGGDTVIARYRVSSDPNRADHGSAAILLRIDQPFSNHNGGQLQFGPDGMLYIGMGDGGSANDPQCNAQRGDTLLGKMLRLDVDQSVNQQPFHGIPGDNPFVDSSAMRDEVWALGLRNPWRFSFDRQTGDLYLGDVGQGAREEIDFQAASSPGGENYGWKMMEGTLCLGSVSGCGRLLPGCNDPVYTPPVFEYVNEGANCAVTGGYVYRGAAIPELRGEYVYGDFCSGRVWAGRRSGATWSSRELDVQVQDLSSFGEDAAGELYLVSLSGTVYRLVGPPAPGAPGQLRFDRATHRANEGSAQATITVERALGSDGEVSVTFSTSEGSAEEERDYQAVGGVLTWADGDVAPKSFTVALLDDVEPELTESLILKLDQATGGAELGRSRATLEIDDNDVHTGPCQASPSTLCLNDGRFQVRAEWEEPTGDRGLGQAIELTTDSGYFWFFDDTNVELVVKVLDACGPFDRFWVFTTGLTNVEVRMSVLDTETAQLRIYENPLGTPFQPILDTGVRHLPLSRRRRKE